MDGILAATAPALLTTTVFDLSAFQHTFLWAVIVGFIVAFILAFGMGGNDVANAFGTSVGSKVLTLPKAYILACIFETLGAVLVGYNVIDTMRKGVVDVGIYNNTVGELMLGEVATLGGCATWLIVATILQLPVSTTHSIVGATLGFTIVCKGLQGVQWMVLLKIVASWFISPIFSGTMSVCVYLIVDHSVLRRQNPIKCGYIVLPIFYFVCLAFNTFMVVYQGSRILHLSSVPLWLSIVIALGVGLIAGLVAQFILIPYLKRKINAMPDVEAGEQNYEATEEKKPIESRTSLTESVSNLSVIDLQSTDVPRKPTEIVVPRKPTEISPETTSFDSFEVQPDFKNSCNKGCFGFIRWFLPARNRALSAKVYELFKALQVFTACFAGFSHGANDVSNAIAPLSAIWSLYEHHNVYQQDNTPIWLLLYGVLGICVGLCCLGHRVIRTVGTNMSEVNPASGFSIEFGAAVTALIASKLGLPISTTHCLVGSVVFVGVIRSENNVDWKIFRNVAASWVITLPAAGLVAAGMMALLKLTL